MALLARAGAGGERFGTGERLGHLVVHQGGAEKHEEVAPQAVTHGEIRVGFLQLLDGLHGIAPVFEEVIEGAVE